MLRVTFITVCDIPERIWAMASNCGSTPKHLGFSVTCLDASALEEQKLCWDLPGRGG